MLWVILTCDLFPAAGRDVFVNTLNTKTEITSSGTPFIVSQDRHTVQNQCNRTNDVFTKLITESLGIDGEESAIWSQRMPRVIRLGIITAY